MTLDSTLPTVGSQVPTVTILLSSPSTSAWWPPIQCLIPSPHYQQRLKKTYFMFYKAREPTGNESVPAWKTNKENEGEKSAAERRIHSSSARATG